MKKLLLTVILASLTVNANTFQDLEISNQLLAAGEYGQKSAWSVGELKEIENLISKFSDDSLKQIWSGNLILYALTANGFGNQPSRGHCLIAKNNIPKLKDDDLIALWKMNYSLYGCI